MQVLKINILISELTFFDISTNFLCMSELHNKGSEAIKVVLEKADKSTGAFYRADLSDINVVLNL